MQCQKGLTATAEAPKPRLTLKTEPADPGTAKTACRVVAVLHEPSYDVGNKLDTARQVPEQVSSPRAL